MVRLTSNGRRVASARGGLAAAGNDYTGRVLLTGLAPGRDYEATTWFAHPDGTRGEPRTTATSSWLWPGRICARASSEIA